MTVSGISSVSGAYQTDAQNPSKQRVQVLKELQASLQTGDLSGARQAFAALQKDLQTVCQTAISSGTPGSNGTRIASNFQALQSALNSGDLSTAQQAFAGLKQDIPGLTHALRQLQDSSATSTGQGANSTSASSQSAQAPPDFDALLSALSSGNLAGAQQVFSAILQGRPLSNGPASSPVTP
jgi:hypothetical protein